MAVCNNDSALRLDVMLLHILGDAGYISAAATYRLSLRCDVVIILGFVYLVAAYLSVPVGNV
jgi:hypothetical protein